MAEKPVSSFTIPKQDIPEQDVPMAAALLAALDHARSDETAHLAIVNAEGEPRQVEMPRSTMLMLKQLMSWVVRDEEVSLDAAAAILAMDRATVSYRLTTGDIPHRLDGRHPRIRVSDLLAFKAADERERAALVEFGEQTDELTLAHGI